MNCRPTCADFDFLAAPQAHLPVPNVSLPYLIFDFFVSEDCADVCDGTFAFKNLTDAVACCKRTRSITDNTYAPTPAPTMEGTENLGDESTGPRGNPGTTASCRNLGGPKDTSVRVRYGEELDQCLLCVGATMEGDACGAPGSAASNMLPAVSRGIMFSAVILCGGFAVL